MRDGIKEKNEEVREEILGRGERNSSVFFVHHFISPFPPVTTSDERVEEC